MQDEQQDILYRAAEIWKELTEYHYVFSYGYKGELHEIKLTFSPEDFPHLAGFHYLKDIALPRYSPRKTVDMILFNKIIFKTPNHCKAFSMVRYFYLVKFIPLPSASGHTEPPCPAF